MIDKPWEHFKWLPGVLNKTQMKDLIECDLLKVPNKEQANKDMDYSALDLHLEEEGFELINGTLKPIKGKSYSEIFADSYYTRKLDKCADGYFKLEPGKSYVFKLAESFRNSILEGSPIHAQATAKSSIGRLDVIARLIVDGMGEYETMIPTSVHDGGGMYIEITPITFGIKVKKGDSLSQIRFFNGHFDDSVIKGNRFYKYILHSNDNIGGTLSVNINNDVRVKAAAFEAITSKQIEEDQFITLSHGTKHDPKKFWTLVNSTDCTFASSIKIKQDSFYILRSKERISLPGGVAVYCKAMDETIGELRIHYAGFVHPFFGFKREDTLKGTPLIFEVRGHNVTVNLTENEILARLVFYRMSMDAEFEETETNSNEYNEQELKLSKYFNDWELE